MASGIQGVEARVAIKHTTVHRTARPPAAQKKKPFKGYLAAIVNSAEGGKTSFSPLPCVMFFMTRHRANDSGNPSVEET